MYIVSSCLLGENCKYNGGNNYNDKLVKALEGKSYVSVCPEMAAGLSCPRCPAEYQGNRIVGRDGVDLTKEFEEGSTISFETALNEAKRRGEDRKSTRLNSSHANISYAVFCLKKNNNLSIICLLFLLPN